MPSYSSPVLSQETVNERLYIGDNHLNSTEYSNSTYQFEVEEAGIYRFNLTIIGWADVNFYLFTETNILLAFSKDIDKTEHLASELVEGLYFIEVENLGYTVPILLEIVKFQHVTSWTSQEYELVDNGDSRWDTREYLIIEDLELEALSFFAVKITGSPTDREIKAVVFDSGGVEGINFYKFGQRQGVLGHGESENGLLLLAFPIYETTSKILSIFPAKTQVGSIILTVAFANFVENSTQFTDLTIDQGTPFIPMIYLSTSLIVWAICLSSYRKSRIEF